MNQKTFNKLSLDAKRALLQNEGTFLATRQYRAHTVHLYDLNAAILKFGIELGMIVSNG